MNQDEKELLQRSLDLAEKNNRILLDLHKALKWARIWGVIKVVVLVLPFIFGYVYLRPYFGPLGQSFQGVQELIKSFR